MTYTNQQLIDALVKEYEWLCHDDFDPDNDPTPEQYLDAIKDLSYDELVEETQTDEIFTLDQFMRNILMTYEAEVQFKFDATFTPTYGTSSWTDDDFIPEEHYLITAPAADLNCKQYFKLFEKFLLCVGMDPKSIRSGAMSLVFNDYTNEEEQRKVCKEYEITMDEDLEKKYQEWKERDAQWAKMNAHYKENFGSEPKDLGRFQRFIQYTDEQLQVMADMYDRAKIKGEWVDSADGVA